MMVMMGHWRCGHWTLKGFGCSVVTVVVGWSLFLKSDLNLMGIKSCALFTELERIVVESLVFFIGKSIPQPNH